METSPLICKAPQSAGFHMEMTFYITKSITGKTYFVSLSGVLRKTRNLREKRAIDDELIKTVYQKFSRQKDFVFSLFFPRVCAQLHQLP